MHEDAITAGGVHLWQLYSTVKSKEQESATKKADLANVSNVRIKKKKKKASKVAKSKSKKSLQKKGKRLPKDSLKSKLKQKKKSSKDSKKSDLQETVDLEDIVDESDSEESDESIDSDEITIEDFEEINDAIDYSPLRQEFLMQQTSYFSNQSSYFASFDADFNPYEAKPIDGYSMQDSLTMDAQEASESIENLMTDSLTASGYSQVNHKNKERLSNWIMFNPAEFKFYESTSLAPTRDTNFQYNA